MFSVKVDETIVAEDPDSTTEMAPPPRERERDRRGYDNDPGDYGGRSHGKHGKHGGYGKHGSRRKSWLMEIFD